MPNTSRAAKLLRSAALAGVLASVGGARAADANLQEIVRTGTPAPTIAGATFSSIGSRGMGPGGHAIFDMTLAGLPITTLNDEAIYSFRDGQLSLIWRESDPLPAGFPVGARYASGPLGIQMDSFGRAYFSPALTNAGTGVRAWFRTDGASVQELIRIGQGAPNALGTIAEFQSGFAVTPGGEFVLLAQLSGAGVTTSNDWFFYRWQPSGASLLARESQALGSTGTNLAIPSLPSFVVLAAPAEAGQFLIASGTSETTLTHAVFGQPPLGSMTTFFQPGPSPLTTPASITHARAIAATPRGDLFAVVQTNTANESLIVKRPGLAPQRVLRDGDSIGGVVITDIHVPGSPIVVGPNGDCVLLGRVSGNDTLILIDPTGLATILARIGQPLFGDNIVALFENSTSPHAGIDAQGNVAFNATTRTFAGVTLRGVYVHTPGVGLRSVLRTNDTLPGPGGTTEVVLNARIQTSVDNPVPGGLAVAPNGRFVIAAATLVGGQTNVFLLARTALCNSIDFNNDGVFPDIADITLFLSVFGGGSCATCESIDFNNDGVFPDLQDIIKYLDVFGGGAC
jgi:hypothetical protein